MSIYEYSVPTPKGENFSLSAFEGKVFLVVNTATGCGFTPQYKDLEEMYEKYHDRGFEILDIPCNQFAGQTPGTDDEIHEFCTLRYNTKFPQMKKSDVNGENELPLYTYLKGEKGFEGLRASARARWRWPCPRCSRRSTGIIRTTPPSSGTSPSSSSTAAARSLPALSRRPT